ncbi:MAG: polyphosphate kinase 2 family protein [Vulcanimicrobiaceae bacterium]
MDVERFIIKPSSRVRLQDYDAGETPGFESKSDAGKTLKDDIGALADLQDRLIAQGKYGVLVVLQGMDTAGKDGVVKHVMTGVNPAGVNVHAFKKPSAEEARHDYLWRTSKANPARGEIAIFNRSYYENVLVTRVHPELLADFQEEAARRGDGFWQERYDDINDEERYLAHNDIVIIKLFLHISKNEQKIRLESRLDDPSKHWKFSAADLQERGYWDAYVNAYECTLSETSTEHAPWYVIPADRKWFARLAVAAILVRHLVRLDPQYPTLSPELQAALERAKASIEAEPG